MKSYFSGQNSAKLRNKEILFPTDYLLAQSGFDMSKGNVVWDLGSPLASSLVFLRFFFRCSCARSLPRPWPVIRVLVCLSAPGWRKPVCSGQKDGSRRRERAEEATVQTTEKEIEMAPPPPLQGGAAATQVAGTAQQPPQQGLGQVLFGIVRMGLFWYFAMQMFGGGKKVTNPALLTTNLFSKGESLVLHLLRDCEVVIRALGIFRWLSFKP